MGAASLGCWHSADGVVASTLSKSATVLPKNKKPGSGSDRTGTDELDGYRLTLKFDDGRGEHYATFTGSGKKSVWFEGANLSSSTKKK